MPRRSKLDSYRDQIAQWAKQGWSDARIAAKLEEYGVKITGQAVGLYRNKLMAPTLSRFSMKAEVQLGTLEQIATEALSKYVALISKAESEMTLNERNYFRTIGEWFDRIAKLRGLYPRNGTNVAVGVGVKVEQDTLTILNKWLDEG